MLSLPLTLRHARKGRGPRAGGPAGTLRPIAALVSCLLLPDAATAGQESYDATFGKFNQVVSLRWNATGTELEQICAELQQASDILYDATDGQHQFGTILIANNSSMSNAATHWIFQTTGTSSAPSGNFGVVGQHTSLFRGPTPATRWPNVIIHESAHLFYCVRDEYEGPPGSYTVTAGCLSSCAGAGAICVGNDPDYECLMEGPDSNDTEFCTASNHDPDLDTEQECDHGQSCWERMVSAGFGLVAPAGLPDIAPPAGGDEIGCVFLAPSARIVLVVDRSGSMAGLRLIEAKNSASLVVDLVETGTRIGVVSFADASSPDFGLTPMNTNTDRNNAKSAITGLLAGGATNYSAGLDEAFTMFSGLTLAANNNVIFFSDGANNRPLPDPDAALNTSLTTLADNNIPVNTVGIGDLLGTPEETRLEDMANATGGEYFRSPISSGAKTSPLAESHDLPADFQPASTAIAKRAIGQFNNTDMRSHYARLWAYSEDYGILLEEEAVLDANNFESCVEILVDEYTNPVTIVCNWSFESFEGFAEVCFVTPQGRVICARDAEQLEGVDYRENPGGGYALYRLSRPFLEPGVYQICVQAFDASQGRVSLRCQAFGRSPEIWAHARMDKAGVYGRPENPVIEVTPIFQTPISDILTPHTPEKRANGFDVIGRVINPDGMLIYEFALNDDGAYAGVDVLRGDGTWAGVIPNSVLVEAGAKPGTYTVDVLVNQLGEAYHAGAHAKPEPGWDVMQDVVPRFVRKYRTSFVYEPDFVITGTPESFDPARNPIRFLGSQPNPFGESTTISFEITRPSQVDVRVFNARGELVATVFQGDLPAGRRSLIWSGKDDGGRDVASGVYYYRVDADEYSRTGRLVKLR